MVATKVAPVGWIVGGLGGNNVVVGWRDDDAEREPPPEAYGRCSDPERYRILHEWGWALLDRLTGAFDVERVDVTGREPSPDDSGPAPAVRLAPRDPQAGPLTVVFDASPGLGVRCGRWRDVLLPECGCDACDERPEDLWDELQESVTALISGNLVERLSKRRRGWYVEYEIPGRSSGGGGVAPAGDSGRFSALSGWASISPDQLQPGTVRWDAWPLRERR